MKPFDTIGQSFKLTDQTLIMHGIKVTEVCTQFKNVRINSFYCLLQVFFNSLVMTPVANIFLVRHLYCVIIPHFSSHYQICGSAGDQLY